MGQSGGGGGGSSSTDSAIMGGTAQDVADAADEAERKKRIDAFGKSSAQWGGANQWSTGMQNKAGGDQGGAFPTQGGGQGSYPQYGRGFSANWWDG